jgi:phosphohistidine phosphatase SixA
MACLTVLLLPVTAFAQAPSAPGAWLDSVRQGGYVIVVRHGLTGSDASKDAMANPAKSADKGADKGAGKSADSMSNPAKAGSGERQLSEQGRAQATSIGQAMHKLKIPVGLVMTSPLQRAVDTGTLLGFGDVVTDPDIAEAGPTLPNEENERRAEALRRLLALRSPTGKNVVVVTHKPNITGAFGKDWSDVVEGETSVFQSDGKGGYKLIARIRPDAWAALNRPSDTLEGRALRLMNADRRPSSGVDCDVGGGGASARRLPLLWMCATAQKQASLHMRRGF